MTDCVEGEVDGRDPGLDVPPPPRDRGREVGAVDGGSTGNVVVGTTCMNDEIVQSTAAQVAGIVMPIFTRGARARCA